MVQRPILDRELCIHMAPDKSETSYSSQLPTQLWELINEPIAWEKTIDDTDSDMPDLINVPEEVLFQDYPSPLGVGLIQMLPTNGHLHFTPSWSPSTKEVSSRRWHFSNFKTTESLDLHLQSNTKEYSFSHITKYHLLQNVFKPQDLWSFHQFIKQGWRRN